MMQDSLRSKGLAPPPPKGSRSYSTSTTPSTSMSPEEGLLALGLAKATDPASGEPSGVKFGLPTLPLPRDAQMKKRYDTVVHQVTRMLMRHGRLSEAERVCTHVPQAWRNIERKLNILASTCPCFCRTCAPRRRRVSTRSAPLCLERHRRRLSRSTPCST